MSILIVEADKSIEEVKYSKSKISQFKSETFSLNPETYSNFEDPFFDVPAAIVTMTGVYTPPSNINKR